MMSNDTPIGEIKVGEMRFLDNSIPKLAAGTYKIDVKHDIYEPSHDIKGNYELSQEFIVQSPRFSLPPNSVQSKFPLPESNTDFSVSLPYIVFNQEHLLWSREIGGNIPKGSPWMALMVLEAKDIYYVAKPDADPKVTPVPDPTLSTVRDVRTGLLKPEEANITGPDISLDDTEKYSNSPLRANTIDVFYSSFKKLAPYVAELPFLAHVRKTNNGGLVADGETAVRSYGNLLANRLADPKTEKQYIAHLVSLEGWADYLPGGTPPKPVTDGLKLRLVSLLSWKFNNKKSDASFAGLVESLSVDTLKLPFTPPAEWGTDESKYTVAQKEVKKKYDHGHIALNYDTRTGEKSFAWYRGPFTPVVPVRIAGLVPEQTGGIYATHITSADEAMIYNADTGIFDQSYAVAWELGRMLTLGNRPAAIAIWQWKKQSVQKLQVLNRMVTDLQKRRSHLLGSEQNLALGEFLKGLDWAQVRDDLMDDQAGKFIFMNYLGRGLGRHILGLDNSNGFDNGPAISMLDPTGLQQHLDSMPGLLSKNEMLSALENGIDPHVLISNKLDALTGTNAGASEQ